MRSGPWVMAQRWESLLFAHWRIEHDVVREIVPEPFEIDVMDGSAWIGLTPFDLTHLRVRGLPPIPGAAHFPEMNLRTYVRYRGLRGIWFFTLEATSPLAVAGSRLGYGLPYHLARMRIERSGEWVAYRSRRVSPSAPGFAGRYRPTGPVLRAEEGTLEHFLTERYSLFVRRGGVPMRSDITHPPWPLQGAEAEISELSLPSLYGVAPQSGEPMLFHFAARQDTRIFRLRRA